MIKHYITAKFLALFIPGFLLFTSLFIYASSQMQISNASDQLAARIGTQLARTSGLISHEMIQNQPKLASKFLSMLMSDSAIVCADTTIVGKTIPGTAQPFKLGCEKLQPEKTVEAIISTSPEFKLIIGFNEDEISVLRNESTLLAFYTIFAGLIISVVFGVVAFRHSVGKPVANLLSAITSSKKDKLSFVNVTSSDEIGNLCGAFNSMQSRIMNEESHTKEALEKLSTVYNSTPALLFTMDEQGIIQSTSEYWMIATGYSATEIIGHSLECLMCPDSRSRLKSSVLADLQSVGSVRDVPIQFWHKNGEEVDVLLSIVPDRREGDKGKSFVCIMNDVTLLRHTEKDLRALAITDQLTKLPNRHAVNEHIELLTAEADPTDKWAMLFLDLDNFKTVNDSFGHEAGDEILRTAAKRIRKAVKEGDLVARIGGDEFVVILRNLSGVEDAKTVATRLIASITKPVKLKNGFGVVGTSIGIAYCENNSINPTEALRLSDQAMYLAKSRGNNKFSLFEEGHGATVRSRAEQVQLIQNGLDNHWFEIFFQPIINIETQETFAFEALLRVKKDGDFSGSIEGLIKIAEETGHMEALGEWIFKESILTFRNFCKDNGDKDIAISINLSPLQLTENFVREVKIQLLKYPDMAPRLIFEITETAALGRFDAVCYLLQDLRDLGVRIAIDDFGTGYSSLSYISRLPIDILKLDKSFIESVDSENLFQAKPGAHQALLRAIATLATDLGLDIVAEGIETADLVKQYKSLGVKFGQGYLFSKPMSAPDTENWLSVLTKDPERPDNLEPNVMLSYADAH